MEGSFGTGMPNRKCQAVSIPALSPLQDMILIGINE